MGQGAEGMVDGRSMSPFSFSSMGGLRLRSASHFACNNGTADKKIPNNDLSFISGYGTQLFGSDSIWSDLIRFDRIRFDQSRSDSIRSDSIRLDHIRSDSIRFDTIRFVSTMSDSIRQFASGGRWRKKDRVGSLRFAVRSSFVGLIK